MKIYKIYENLCKSMKIYKNLWKSMKFMTCMGYICFKQRKCVIFYVLNIYTPHISALQRKINCFNRENENRGFRGNMDFDLQNTGQSHYFDENLKWSHCHYGHFAPAGLTGNPDRSSVFDKSVGSGLFQSLGLSLGSIFNDLTKILGQFRRKFDPD